MNIHKQGQRDGGVNQSQMVYQCSKCQGYGKGNKMINHMKNCDGSGFKNYWSKQRSLLLESLVNSILQIF